MSINEQIQIKTTYFNEAIRYMDNAKDVLKKAGKDDDYYADEKYVKMATETAYSAVLKYFETVYRVLHLEGYYEGETYVSTIQSGFTAAYSIIEKIKP